MAISSVSFYFIRLCIIALTKSVSYLRIVTSRLSSICTLQLIFLFLPSASFECIDLYPASVSFFLDSFMIIILGFTDLTYYLM